MGREQEDAAGSTRERKSGRPRTMEMDGDNETLHKQRKEGNVGRPPKDSMPLNKKVHVYEVVRVKDEGYDLGMKDAQPGLSPQTSPIEPVLSQTSDKEEEDDYEQLPGVQGADAVGEEQRGRALPLAVDVAGNQGLAYRPLQDWIRNRWPSPRASRHYKATRVVRQTITTRTCYCTRRRRCGSRPQY